MLTLDEYREFAELETQRKTAEHFGVNQSTVNRWIARGDVAVELDETGRGWTRVYTPVQKKAPD